MYPLRLLGLTCGLFMLVFAFGWAGRDSLAELGLNVWDLPDAVHVLAAEKERRAQLDETFASVNARLRLKQNLAEDLVAGRLTLPEAVARLRPLMGPEESQCWRLLRHSERASTDEERLSWHLIGVARRMVEADYSPEEASRVTQLLTRQLPPQVPPPSLPPVLPPGRS